MTSLIANILKMVGGFGAKAGSTACTWWLYDEPKCPKSLIK